MSFKLFSDVRETSTTGGTGDQVLTGSAFDTSYVRFNDRYSNADTFFYRMKQPGVGWEIGLGTRVTSGDKITRTQVYKSSNSNALVNFTNGVTIDIFVTNIAPQDLDAAGLVLLRLSQGGEGVGYKLTAAVAASALTVNLKTNTGNDPSATEPVVLKFRDPTASNGGYFERNVTAALSLVISSGSTMGFTSGLPARLWIGALDNAGTVELFAINCLSGTNIYPLGQFPLITTTAEGGAGAADSAHVPYSTAARTSAAYRILGYLTWEAGLATAGTWTPVPTRIQEYRESVPLPGIRIQLQRSDDGASATGTTLIPFDNTVPQNTEGDQFMSRAITPSSAASLLRVRGQFNVACSAVSYVGAALFQDSAANALKSTLKLASVNEAFALSLDHRLLSTTTGSTTFKIRIGGNLAETITFNGEGGNPIYGGTMNSFLEVEELQV